MSFQSAVGHLTVKVIMSTIDRLRCQAVNCNKSTGSAKTMPTAPDSIPGATTRIDAKPNNQRCHGRNTKGCARDSQHTNNDYNGCGGFKMPRS